MNGRTGAIAPFPAPVRGAPTPRLSAASIPKILLGLGALCLLVAALVFLAVAWSAMGMGGRTAVLVGLSVTAAALCAWVSSQGLRAGAEAFVVVALGLLTLDVFGAESAGWLGDISGPDFAMLLGGVLGVAGVVAGVLALRSPVERLVGAELTAALGLLLVAVGWLSSERLDLSAGYVAAVLVSAAVAIAAWRARLVALAFAAGALAPVWWLLLLGDGVTRGLSEPTLASLWGDLQIWPVLAAATIAAAPVAVLRLPYAARVAAAGVGLTVLSVAAGMPAVGDPLTVGAVVALAVLAAAAGIAAFAPGRWGWSAAGSLTLSGLFTFGVLAELVGQAASRVLAEPWSVAADSRLGGGAPDASPMLVLPSVVLLVAAMWATLTLLGESPVVRRWLTPALGGLAGSVAVTLALYEVPRWSVVAVLLVGAVAVWAASGERVLGHVVVAVVGAAALIAALPSSWLTAAALLVLTALAFTVDLRHEGALQEGAALLSMPLLGGLLWTLGHLALMPEAWLPVLVVAVLGLLLLIRPAPTYELAAAPTALVAILTPDLDLTWLAVYLTLSGALVTASALLHRRRDLGWIGSALLFLGTWVRLADLDVTTVEAYTLPLALALIGFGLVRMHREHAGTVSSLSAGLGLAVVPSLLQALVDPVSTRALLLGLGCVVLVVAGASLRWSAPLLIGAGAGLLLVLREAAYAQVLPQWVVIGLVGALLTVIGVTWERRLQELRRAAGYVRHLR